MRAVVLTGAAAALSLLLFGGAPALAGDGLSLASGHPGTPAYAAGVGLSSLIKFELLPREKIDLQVRTSSGPVDNVHLLRRGRGRPRDPAGGDRPCGRASASAPFA
ncbi:MAG: hypothetical protein HC871_07335, partial [Rhizobiales bacterium]|nr:hypothetical protein [Hyphomicrobiales bacterium]